MKYQTKKALVICLCAILAVFPLALTGCGNQANSASIAQAAPSSGMPSAEETVFSESISSEVIVELSPPPNISPEKETIFTKSISNKSKEEALEQLYKTTKAYFASWNAFTFEDWKAAYPSELERVLATNSIYDFYMELKRFVTLLNDHHSEVAFPQNFYEDLWFTPVRFIYLDGGYYIVGGNSGELKKLPLFSKITTIDGLSIESYMEQNVYPYIWHAKLNTAVSGGGSLMARFGPEGTSQSFEALTPAGEAVTAIIDRISYKNPTGNWVDATLKVDTAFEDVFSSDLLTIKRIDGDYLYVYIPHFQDENVVAQFEAQLDLLKAAKGIILDVRGNQGGNASYGAQIASHFIDGAFPELYVEKSVYNIRTDEYRLQEVRFSDKRGIGDITSPVVVLQDYLTFSAGEHFLDFMSCAKNAKSIGTESAGATGDSKWIELPEGGSARISYYKIYRHDKTPFLNIGIQPDVFVGNSIDDYANGYDRILDAGLAELYKMCGGE